MGSPPADMVTGIHYRTSDMVVVLAEARSREGTLDCPYKHTHPTVSKTTHQGSTGQTRGR